MAVPKHLHPAMLRTFSLPTSISSGVVNSMVSRLKRIYTKHYSVKMMALMWIKQKGP
jgi:hypothetical protein